MCRLNTYLFYVFTQYQVSSPLSVASWLISGSREWQVVTSDCEWDISSAWEVHNNLVSWISMNFSVFPFCYYHIVSVSVCLSVCLSLPPPSPAQPSLACPFFTRSFTRKVSRHCSATRLHRALGRVVNDRQFTKVCAGPLICPRNQFFACQIIFFPLLTISQNLTFLYPFSPPNFDQVC